MIAVGQLDTPIVIEKPTFTSNANYGGIQDETWSLATTSSYVWSHLVYRGGKEDDEAEQKVGQQKVDFYIRFGDLQDTIQPSWRIKYENSASQSVYYYIESIAQVDGRHKMTKITALAKDNN